MDITPLHEHALMLKNKIYQAQLKVTEEVYKIKQEKSRLQEISAISTNFRTRTQEIEKNIQVHLSQLETNAEILENAPQKSTKNLQIEYELMDFSSKVAEKLTVVVGKTLDKFLDFYKRVLTTHNRCQTSSTKRLQEFLGLK